MNHGKPLIEIVIVGSDDTMTKTTFDFDMVMGVSPFSKKHRPATGPMTLIQGTMLMLKNNREIFVTNPYEEICDQWIKLTHPCVPDGADAQHHVCDHGFAARTCGICNHGTSFGR